MHYGLTSGQYSCTITQAECKTWSTQRLQPYSVVKVGGGMGQDPATEVTHLRLNQPPVCIY